MVGLGRFLRFWVLLRQIPGFGFGSLLWFGWFLGFVFSFKARRLAGCGYLAASW